MYVVGDMDIYIKKEEASSLLLIETLQGIGLKRWIEGTTRYSKNDSCIDLILLNSSNIMNAGILDVDISDHQMVSITKKKQKDSRKKAVFKDSSYTKFDETLFIEYLSNHEWKAFGDETNPERCWEPCIG